MKKSGERMRGLVLGGAVLLASGVWAVAQQSAVPTLSSPSEVAAVSSTQPGGSLTLGPRSPNKTEIQDLLAKVTEAATGKGELPTLVSYLSKRDRDAIGDVRAGQWPDLDGRADEFHKDWQAAFGISFKLSDKQSIVFGDESFPIRAGHEAQESGATGKNGRHRHGGMAMEGATTQPSATTMPMDMSGGASTMPSGMGAMSMEPMPTTAQIDSSMGENPSENEDLAVRSGTVQLPATRHRSSVTLHLVNEGTTVAAWKIDLPPEQLKADRLHDSLLKRLTWLDEHRGNWPTEINQAYQGVSREMLAALVDAASSDAAAR